MNKATKHDQKFKHLHRAIFTQSLKPMKAKIEDAWMKSGGGPVPKEWR